MKRHLMVKRYLTSCGLSVATCFATSALIAQPAEEQARAHFAEGIAFLDEQNYEAALAKFTAAYELWPNPKILLNIGTTLKQLGHNAEAANAYALYLRDPGADPAQAARAAELLSALDQDLARVRIIVNVADAAVTVDGSSVRPALRQALRVAPGAHELVARKPGFGHASAKVELGAGELRTVKLELTDAPQAAVADEDASSRAPDPDLTSTEPARDEGVPKASRSASHAGRLAAFVRGDIDGKGRGAVVAPGVSYGIGDFVAVGVAALLGTEKGAWAGGRIFFTRSALKPSLLLGVPLFAVDGPRLGVHAAAGLVWELGADFGLALDLGVAHFPAAPESYEETVFLPSLGVHVRL